MYSLNMIWMRSHWLNQALLSVLLTAALLMSSGCSSVKPLEIFTTNVETKAPQKRPPVPNPQPIETLPVEWKVLTGERLPQGEMWVYYGLTPDQYEALSRNMAELLRWVKEAKWRLNYYRGAGELDGAQPD